MRIINTNSIPTYLLSDGIPHFLNIGQQLLLLPTMSIQFTLAILQQMQNNVSVQDDRNMGLSSVELNIDSHRCKFRKNRSSK